MANFDLAAITGYETIGSDPATSGGTVVTANASANVKGAWAQLTAATAAQASWIEVSVFANSATSGKYLVDIATGAAGSEVVLVSNIHMDSNQTLAGLTIVRVPVALAAGTRLAARCQSSAAGSSVQVSATLWQGDPGSLTAPGVIDTYGADTTDSGLTRIDPGGTANTDSGWVTIANNTAHLIRWLVLICGHDASAAWADGTRWLVDIATGAAGSEVVLVNDLSIAIMKAGPPGPKGHVRALPVNIPVGTRLSVRARCADINTVNGARYLDVGMIGADASVPSGGGGAGQHAHASWS